jgi:hypothetical protein
VYVHFGLGIEFRGEKVSAAPNLSHTSVNAALRAITSYDATSQQLCYHGVMSSAHWNTLKGLFTSAADKSKVTTLYWKTRKWHYGIRFVQSYSVTVTAAPTATSVPTALQAKVSHSTTDHTLTWTGTGAMTAAERDLLRAAYTGAADKLAMTELYQKTRLTTTNNLFDYATAVSNTEMKAHFLGMEVGADEQTALKFLQNWINDKMRSDGSTPATYSLETISAASGTGAASSPASGGGTTTPSPSPAVIGPSIGP